MDRSIGRGQKRKIYLVRERKRKEEGSRGIHCLTGKGKVKEGLREKVRRGEWQGGEKMQREAGEGNDRTGEEKIRAI